MSSVKVMSTIELKRVELSVGSTKELLNKVEISKKDPDLLRFVRNCWVAENATLFDVAVNVEFVKSLGTTFYMNV